jgi:hypothetical protein
VAKTISTLKSIFTLILLGLAWLVALHYIWPRLLALTILFYFVGVLALFVVIVLYAIFGSRG